MAVAVVAIAAALAAAAPAFGLIQHPNQPEYADNEGWPTSMPSANVAGRWVSNASCVAISPNYIITTRHQSYGVGSSVWFGGTEYRVAEIIIHPVADLRVVRLTAVGGQPANLTNYVDVYTNDGGELGQTVAMGGYGMGRGANLPSGDISPSTYGYSWDGSDNSTLRWGQNCVDVVGTSTYATGRVDPTENYASQYIRADFDRWDAAPSEKRVPYEAAPAFYDSGGGWFINDGGTWKVAGLTLSVEPHGGSSQTWFGTQASPTAELLYAVRVSYYSSWILGMANRATWTSGTDNWNAASHWSTGIVPNAADRWVIFGGAQGQARRVTLDTSVSIGTLQLDGTNLYTFGRDGGSTSTLTFDGTSGATCAINVTGAGTHTIEVPVVLGDSLTLAQGSTGDLVFSGVISSPGASKITKQGAGTLVLAGPNTFPGGVRLEEGTLRITDAAGMGVGAAGIAGGTLDLRSETAVTFNNTTTVSGSSTINVDRIASGAGNALAVKSLTITGNRTLTVTGGHGYSLKVSGTTTLSGVTGTAAINATTADVSLAGGVSMTAGTLSKTGAGTLTLGGTLSFSSGTTLDVGGGTLHLDSNAGGSSPTCKLALKATAADASIVFDSSQHLKSLNLQAGSASLPSGVAKTLVTQSLSIDPTKSSLDLGRGFMVIDYSGDPYKSPLQEVKGWVQAGWSGPDTPWYGTGITSTMAKNDPSLYTVGFVDQGRLLAETGELWYGPGGTRGTTFGGIAVDSTSILVRLTYLGDVDLDGKVYDDDVAIMSGNYSRTGPTGAQYWDGDVFGFDGWVYDDEAGIIGGAYNNGRLYGDPLGLMDGMIGDGAGDLVLDSAGGARLYVGRGDAGGAVPEPASLILIGLGMAALAARPAST